MSLLSETLTKLFIVGSFVTLLKNTGELVIIFVFRLFNNALA